MVMTFSTAEPPWRCADNSTACSLNGTYKVGDQDYEYRCQLDRSDWEFVVDGDFDSIVTEVRINESISLFMESPEGLKRDWDLGVFEAGKWDLMHWEWELSTQEQ